MRKLWVVGMMGAAVAMADAKLPKTAKLISDVAGPLEKVNFPKLDLAKVHCSEMLGTPGAYQAQWNQPLEITVGSQKYRVADLGRALLHEASKGCVLSNLRAITLYGVNTQVKSYAIWFHIDFQTNGLITSLARSHSPEGVGEITETY